MLRRQIATLTAGLESNRVMGAAVGLLMASHSLDPAAAFEELRRRSQHSNVKLVEVARAIIDQAEKHALRERARS